MPCKYQPLKTSLIPVRVFVGCLPIAPWTPIYVNRSISVIQGTESQLQALFDQVADLAGQQCQSPPDEGEPDDGEEKEKLVSISIPIVECRDDGPHREMMTIQVEEADRESSQKQFEQMAAIQEQLCLQKKNTGRVYQILGGDRWFPNNAPKPELKDLYDTRFKQVANAAFDPESGKERDQTAESFIDLLRQSFGSLYFRTGIHEFPAEVSPSLLAYSDDEKPIKIQGLASYLAWFISQFDALIGQFPIQVEIEDIDPATAGNQTKKIEMANLSEALGELYGLATVGSVNSDLALNFLTRLAAETMAAKTAALIAQDYAKANASFMGYDGKPKEREIEFAFNPLKPEEVSGFDQFLQNAKGKIVGWEETDKNSILDYLKKLMFAASILKAAFFRKNSDLDRIEKEIESLVEGPKDDEAWRRFIDLINNPTSPFNVGSSTGDYPMSHLNNKIDPPATP
jgi:hypothetical protein